MKIIEIILKQLISIYVGSSILYAYYKIKGKKVTYSEIVNEIDKSTGLRKYRYISFYIGVFVITIIIVIIAHFYT